MRNILFLFTVLYSVLCYSQHKTNNYYFYENKGQFVDQNGKENKDVKYLYHSAGLNVQLRSHGFSYDVYETRKTPNLNYSKQLKNTASDSKPYHLDEYNYELLFHRIDIELINANTNASLITEGKSPDYDNYYNLSEKPGGITRVHRYQKLTYKDIYPHIDLVFFKPEDPVKPIEYNFIINPGGKISDIKMKFNGAPTLLKNGKLTMNVRFGEIHENIPNSWILNDKKENINVSFSDFGDQAFGFKAPFNTSDKTIVIDPVPTRIWGSYAGGYGEDYGTMKTDIQSTGYLFGATSSSTNFATSGTYQQNIAGNFDAYVVKLTKNGQRLWGTYYGSGMTDTFDDLDFDENFNVFAGGSVQRGPYNKNIVLVKFNSTGGLLFQKEFASGRDDKLYTVSYNQNHVFFGGDSFSDDFPTVNAMQPNKLTPIGLTDGIVASLDSATGNVDWATYFGKADGSTSIVHIMSSADHLEMLGLTQSANIPMINAFQPVKGGLSDGIYLKLSKNGNTLLRSSYYGNEYAEVIWQGRIINNTLIIPGKYSTPAFPSGQPGIWRVNLATNAISKNYFNFEYSYQLNTYTDTSGNVFFAGLHSSGQSDISTPGAYMGMPPMYNSTFLIKYNQNDVKEWGTYYTGNGATQLGLVTKDNEGAIYFTGMSSGNTAGIATAGTFQQQPGGGNDIFIAKFQDCTSSAVVTSNSPVCPNSTLQLSATGGSAYSWTGPNGFTSNLQSPSIPNATAANSGIYTCQVSGSGACDGSFTVNVVVGDNVGPVPNVTTLPSITGNCHTLINDIPTATDHCVGTITATTTDPLTYSIPGTYTIHWSYNDGNGNITTQNQTVTVNAVQNPVANTAQTFCAANHPKVSDLQVTGQNIKWYDAAGNLLPATAPIVNGQTFYATQTINSCESGKTAVQVIVSSTPVPIANAAQDFCASASPTLANLMVTGISIVFYNASGNVLPLSTPLVHGQTYYVTQTINGCESDKFAVSVTLSINNVPATNYTEILCNTNTGNTMNINLHSYEGNIINNPGNYIFSYTDMTGNVILNAANYTLTMGTSVIIVKVSTADGCFTTVRLTLTLNPKPVIELSDHADFCEGKTVTLDAGPGFTSYLWSTGAISQSITVSTPGTYTVTVKNIFGCENTKSVQVNYSVLATIVAVNINNNTATIVLSATGSYEYSLDNFTWQDSNIFNNLATGEYTVYVRTKSGCIIGQKKFSVFNIQNAITPNGDGNNDSWKIAGLENYPGTEIYLYDRKGFVILKEVITKKPFVWDGKYHQQPVATGNYWYTIKVSDGRTYSGWLLVKNRD